MVHSRGQSVQAVQDTLWFVIALVTGLTFHGAIVHYRTVHHVAHM